jgi:hypothetical protein
MHGLFRRVPARCLQSRARRHALLWRGGEIAMSVDRPDDSREPIPLGQRLFDRPYLLLVACIVVMFVFYTGWGLVELASLTDAPLP